jgi:hypothetical protein
LVLSERVYARRDDLRLSPEEPLDKHRHKNALNDDSCDGLDCGKPGLERIQTKLCKEDPAMDGIEANLHSIKRLLLYRLACLIGQPTSDKIAYCEEKYYEYIGKNDAS